MTRTRITAARISAKRSTTDESSHGGAEENVADAVFGAIDWRQHVAPKRLVAPGPDDAQVERLFQAAAAAPDHGTILPWRFVIVPRHKRESLAQAFVQALTDRDPAASEADITRAREKAFRAPFLAAAIVRLALDAEPEIPNAERLVSLGAALQNMLVAATALGFGSGLTSGKSMTSARMRALFALADDEQAVCFVNIGTVSKRKAPRERPTTSRFVTSL